MKFKLAVILSVILHLSLFTLAIYMPSIDFGKKETVYYVDFLQLPGGGGDGKPGGGASAEIIEEPVKNEAVEAVKDSAKGVKDLTVKKAEEPDNRMRFPDKDKKKDQKKTKKPVKKKPKPKEELISVVRKDKRETRETRPTGNRGARDDSAVRIGIGGGDGPGSGGGTGSGMGGSFPYAYYVDQLRNKISSSWYTALVSPGIRGRYIITVHCEIWRNGRLKTAKLHQGSGIHSLDLSALRAVQNAAPFPPLPHDFSYSYLSVYFDFEWGK